MFEQKYEKYQNLLSENSFFLEVKFSVYLNRRAFVMYVTQLMPFLTDMFHKLIYFHCQKTDMK